MNYEARIAEDGRLYILKELARQLDGRLNVILLERLLQQGYGINRSREWIETQLRKLEELGAIELSAGALLIATIVRAGRDHLEQKSVIAGVTKPFEVE